MRRVISASLLIVTLLTGMLNAQNQDISILISTYGSLPSGDYGVKIGDDAKLTRRAGFDIGNNIGLAQTGYGAGIELYSSVIMDGLGWVVSLRYISNPTNSTEAESRFEYLLGDGIDLKYETGTWIHIPVMTGFRYTYNFSANLGLSALLQAGINVVKAPSRKASIGDIKAEETTYKFARDYGFEVGLGVRLYKRWNIGFSYLSLNSPSFEGTRKLSEKVFPNIFSRESAIDGETRSASMFLISVGYYLF